MILWHRSVSTICDRYFSGTIEIVIIDIYDINSYHQRMYKGLQHEIAGVVKQYLKLTIC